MSNESKNENERIDLTRFEENIETANAYMESWFKGTVTPMNGKEWRNIKDLGLHVDWSHNEVFGPLVEEFPALIAELKRCYEKIDAVDQLVCLLDELLDTDNMTFSKREEIGDPSHLWGILTSYFFEG